MYVDINYDGIYDHLDILSNQIKKSNNLIELLQSIQDCTPETDFELKQKVKEIQNQVITFQKNANDRKGLLLDIVSILKEANIRTHSVLDEIQYDLNRLSDGGESE